MTATPAGDISGDLARLRARMSGLRDRDDQAIAGFDLILAGLDEALTQLATRDEDDPSARARDAQLSVLAHGLHAVLDLFDPAPEPTPEPAPAARSTPAQGLQQFISAFRNEARKRMSGLSISMMGLFSPRASQQTLEQSAHHLHAIRGGAAMLDLKPVAELSGLMEQLIVAMRKVAPEARQWPTQALLQGYRLIERALEDPQVHVDPIEAQQVKAALSECFDTLSVHYGPASEVSEASVESARQERALLGMSAQHAGGAAQPPPPAPLEQRVLIVDDVETIAASVGFVLSELDVPMDIAQNGQEALQMLQQRPYSLVISDIAMPRMDGVALTRVIRTSPQLKDIPVILLTALDHPTERDAGIEAGANDYIIKGSIGGGELVHRVRELLKIAPFVPVSPPRQTRGQRRVLIAEDAETVAASIAFVLSEGDYDIVLTTNGMEALTRLEREPFDLLISDWQMPQMSGIELVRAVRASTIVRPLPIILLTSLADDVFRQQAYKAGADTFMVKGEVGGGLLLGVAQQLLRDYDERAGSHL